MTTAFQSTQGAVVLVAHVGFRLALDRCLVVVIGGICDLGADAPQHYDNTMEFDYTVLARLSKDIYLDMFVRVNSV